MICDLELLKLADGEQTNHVTADIVFSGECPIRPAFGIFWLHSRWYFAVDASGTVLSVTVHFPIVHSFLL